MAMKSRRGILLSLFSGDRRNSVDGSNSRELILTALKYRISRQGKDRGSS
jgi:hypothetical protein